MESSYIDYYCDYCKKEFSTKKREYRLLLEGKKKTLCCSIECAKQLRRTGSFIKCENCGKTVYKKRVEIENKKHHFCCLKCSKDFIHKQTYEIRKCEICNQEFECPIISKQRFCSGKCQSKWQKTRIQEKNPKFTSVKKKCSWCNTDIYVKRYKLDMQKHFFCSIECSRKWYGNVYSQSKEWRLYRKEVAVKILKSGAISRINSEPQRILDKLLEQNDIKYEREKGIKYYSIDNYLIDYDLMIEVQGDYWHCNPNKYKDKISEVQYKGIKRDKAKRTYVKHKYNIPILYLWEYDLKNNPVLCDLLIKKYINNNGLLENYNSFNYYIDNSNNISLKDNIIIPFQEKDFQSYKELIIKSKNA